MRAPRPRTLPTQRSLAVVVTDVLGDLAFMVSDDEPLPPPPGAVWLECEITYRGPQSGTLRCWCTRDFAVQLAANLLGIEPDEGDASTSAEDAVREFMNVLCGQLVTAWHGTSPVFTLSIPTVQECLIPPAPAGAEPHTFCQLSISGEPFCCAYQPLDGG